MIPEEFLIQVAPILWIGDFSIHRLMLSFTIVISLFILFCATRFLQGKYRQKNIRKKILGLLPIPGAHGFEQQAALLLRRYIQYIYLPHQSQAHTAKDIASYVDDREIVDVLMLLEEAEYRGSVLDMDIQINVVNTLLKLQDIIERDGPQKKERQ